MTRPTGEDEMSSEHVAHLRRMANESWIGSPERAALDAAIAELSAQQPPAEAQAQGGGEMVAEVVLHNNLLYGRLSRDLPVGAKLYAAPPSAPVGVDVVDRVAAALLEEATDEPWTVAGVEHEGPDRDYYRKLARKVLTLSAQQPAAVDGAIRRDAERYRWLRLHANTEWEAETVLHVVQAGGRTLDLRIDEALAAQQGGSDNDRTGR